MGAECNLVYRNCLDPFYGIYDPYSRLLGSLDWMDVVVLVFLFWGPVTFLLAWSQGQLPSRTFDKIKFVGYMDDYEWFIGHWLLSPAIAGFAMYFYHAVPTVISGLQNSGLLAANLNYGSLPWVNWGIPLISLVIALMCGLILPMKWLLHGNTWRSLPYTSAFITVYLRLTVIINFYLSSLVFLNLSTLMINIDAILKGHRLAVLAADGYGGYGPLVNLYIVITFFSATLIIYLVVLGHFNPVTDTGGGPDSVSRNVPTRQIALGCASIWLLFLIPLYVIPIPAAAAHTRIYKNEMLLLSDEKFVKKFISDNESLGLSPDSKVISDRIDEFRQEVRSLPVRGLTDFGLFPLLSGLAAFIRLAMEKWLDKE